MLMPGNDFAHIIDNLPYAPPFLFVDGLTALDSNYVEGYYRFRADSAFYLGHFKEAPVTPGVLLTECCAQIGLVCLGMYLIEKRESRARVAGLALAESQMEFLEPVYPGEMVRVTGQRVYFRFGKLKCTVHLYNESGALACRGTISGMFKKEAV